MEPPAPVIRRGIIQAFDADTWTATVQVLPSQGNYLTNLQVAKHLLAAGVLPGDQCAILFFDELNPADALVIAVYSIPSAAPVPPVTSLAGDVSGTPLTGDVVLVPGPSGSVTITESGQQIVIDASSSGSGLAPLVNTTTSTVTITDAAIHTLNTITSAIASGKNLRFIASMNFLAAVAGAGLHGYIYEDGSLIVPENGPGTGGRWSNNSNTEGEWHTLVAWYQPGAGTHTYTLRVAAAGAVTTYTIYESYFSVEIF
jgi:hypothetical protein